MKTAPLGAIADIISGATPKTGVAEYWGGDVRWATPADLSKLDGPYIGETPRTLTDAGVKSCATTILPAGSVLLSSRAPIGHVAINTVPMATNQGFKSLVPRANLDAKYLYHWLKSKTDYLQSLGNGATFKELTKKTTEQIAIPLPSLGEQRRIVAILDHADALRTKRRQVLTHLDSLSQSIFLGFQHCPRTTMSLSDAYWFQEGPGIRRWQFTTTGVKLLNVGNIISDGSIDLSRTDRHISDAEATERYKHFLVDEGDLVIASSGISIADDGLLRTRGSFVKAEHLPLCMNTSTIRFKARAGLSDLLYLQAWLGSIEFRRQITRLVTGSAQKNFGPSHLKQLQIKLPALQDQLEFRRRADAIRHGDSGVLDELFKSLHSRAFRGKL